MKTYDKQECILSRMRTAHSLAYGRGLSPGGGLCPGGSQSGGGAL